MLFADVEDFDVPDPWPGRIVGADVSALISIGGAGKGLTCADVVGRVTRGWPMPPVPADDPLVDWESIPTAGQAVMISLEDKPVTVKRRLTAAGADLGRVYDMSRVARQQAGAARSTRFSINDDLGLLRRGVKEMGDVRLVTIDPLFSAARTTVAFNQQLRINLIEPLQEFAADTGVAVLLVHHFTKGSGRRPNSTTDLADYVGGSKGLVDALRMVTVITDDPTNADIKVMQNLKNNEGAKEHADRYIIVAEGPKDPDAHIRWEVPPPKVGDDAARQRLQAVILQELIRAAGPVSPQQMVAFTNLSYHMIMKLMAEMERQGLIEKRRGAYTAVAALEAARPERDRAQLAAAASALGRAGAKARWNRG